ncbi:hypothetical protein SAMN06265795_114123 [Noviherbaspirillum humi]|uniref:Uncharacterized protein n=1 Tax=Noviherbaspirillum humi TaxID=1688639 RepID=A0A239K3X6_9BURK|nr:hypothetical protein [Noviherbaspirillum humi]SNT12835.1 hypothetical protein SAMN06265795_114123 [Noviherbaspirillum humi]
MTMESGRRKMATSDRLLGLSMACPGCDRQITSNGHMYYTAFLKSWSIGFWCPVEKEVFPCWRPEYQSLINEVAAGLDIESLPYEPFHITR